MSFAAEHAERERGIERLVEDLRSERDQAIRTAYHDGLPMAEIASVMDMSHQRVSQIVRS